MVPRSPSGALSSRVPGPAALLGLQGASNTERLSTEGGRGWEGVSRAGTGPGAALPSRGPGSPDPPGA